MKYLFFLALLGFIVWFRTADDSYRQSIVPNTAQMQSMSVPATSPSPVSIFATTKSNNFSCDGRQYCSQMRSRAEAEFFIRNCPNTKMDGDNDGDPCENDSRF